MNIMAIVGIHHGGLLPILKEVIEILFQEGLLKVRGSSLRRSNWAVNIGALCYWDLFYGSEHAGKNGGFYESQKVRWNKLSLG